METCIFHSFLTPLIKTSKKKNVTGQIGWQGKAQTDHKNQRFFWPVIIGFLRSDLEDHIWICQKKSSNYSKLDPKTLN